MHCEDMNITTELRTQLTDLRGQRVVVLGGTSGTGLATARAALDHGAEVTVRSRR